MILLVHIRYLDIKMTDIKNTPDADFSFVRYANCWEDANLLIKSLLPTAGKRILSIASAGDNSLSMLVEGSEVVAADRSYFGYMDN